MESNTNIYNNIHTMVTKPKQVKEINESDENEKVKMMPTEVTKMEFDDLLVHAGERGLFQVLIFLSTMPIYFFGVSVYYSQLFMTQTSSQYWCWVPELANLTEAQRRNASIPRDVSARHGYSQCLQYDLNWSLPQSTDRPWPTTPCRNGWEFSKDIPYPTISSELSWVCDKSSYQSTAQSIFFAGSMCGLLVIGWLADRAGRRAAIVVSDLLGCFGGVASVFATDFFEFSVARFFVGMAFDNCFTLLYMLVLEYTAPKYRSVISNMAFAVFFTIGSVLIPWLALACGHWKIFGLITSAPMMLAVLTPLIFQESPRWLMSKGCVDEVIKNVKTIARINKQSIPDEVYQQFRDTVASKPKEVSGSLWELIRRPRLRRVFLLICALIALCDVLFDASVRTLESLKLDWFVSFSLVSSMELPGVIFAVLLIDRLGRRNLMSILLSLTSVSYMAMAFVPRGFATNACSFTARFAISAAYITGTQWSLELLPTSVRGSGISVAHLVAYTFTLLAQFIIYLGVYISWLPLVVCSILGAIGTFISLALTETAGKNMPQTCDEAEKLIKSHRKNNVIKNRV